MFMIILMCFINAVMIIANLSIAASSEETKIKYKTFPAYSMIITAISILALVLINGSI